MQVPKAVLCLPTYNERENLEPMLRALGNKGVRVLVIDDNSPDGTGPLADQLATELDYVDVLHRERKEGLGPAYLAGFRRALSDGAELVLYIVNGGGHTWPGMDTTLPILGKTTMNISANDLMWEFFKKHPLR